MRCKPPICKVKYFCNESIFKTLNEESAYIYGFFTADGTVHSRLSRLDFMSTDLSELEKIKRVLNFTGKTSIEHYENHFKDRGRFHITSKTLKKTFKDFGLVPRKSYGDPIPKVDLGEFFWVYVRGFMDGDGWVSLVQDKSGRKSLEVGFCAHSRKYLEWLSDNFGLRGIKVIRIHNNGGGWTVRISRRSVDFFMRCVYSGPSFEAGLRFDRKYNKYIEYTERRKP